MRSDELESSQRASRAFGTSCMPGCTTHRLGDLHKLQVSKGMGQLLQGSTFGEELGSHHRGSDAQPLARLRPA